jgi:hypothetical protein
MEERSSELSANAVHLAGRHVLLVEDSAEDAKKYAEWLMVAGARVERVGTMKAARSALGSRHWDLLVAASSRRARASRWRSSV